MKLQYLGTAAAEGIPAIFCECENCKRSRVLGGKNIRTRSQALVDDTLLIDFNADTYMHFLTYNVPLEKIKTCLITHSHDDHLYAGDILMRKNGPFAHVSGNCPLTFYTGKSGYDIINGVVNRYAIPKSDVDVRLIAPFAPFEVEGYKVTPLSASHDKLSSPVVYIIEKDGKSLFYSNDTSEYPSESIEYLKTLKAPLMLVSLDCTEACNHSDYVGHLDIYRCIAVRDMLKEIGAVNESTVFILNHFSHNGASVVYDDFVKIAGEYGFKVSYDGMTVEF